MYIKDVVVNIKGKHWVFIIGFILSAIVALYNSQIASEILELLFWIGVGLFIKG